MELHREFRLDDIEKVGNTILNEMRCVLHNFTKMSDSVCENEKIILPKLPMGTVLIKQKDCSNTDKILKNSITPVTTQFRKTALSKTEKIKSIHQSKKTNQKSQIRRNPVRGTKKKFDDYFTRPRLLATRKRDNNYYENFILDRKQVKLSNLPYMNTRSITKKLYNVGATHQTPTINDEIEWKEWPIHGMHERPIYHPQIGLAVECLGDLFISLNGCSYQKVPQSSTIDIISKDTLLSQTNSHTELEKENHTLSIVEHSFENSMYDSLHSVLAYSVQIIMLQCRQHVNDYKKVNDKNLLKQNIESTRVQESNINSDSESSKLQVAQPTLNLKCIKNHAKLQRVLERGTKNTLILLKTTDPALKNENNIKMDTSGAVSSTLISVKVKNSIDNGNINFKQTSNLHQLSPNNLSSESDDVENKTFKININDETSLGQQLEMQNDDKYNWSNENWLQELISNTAILYCTAMGIHQDDFAMYLNSLDPKQCVNWINLKH